MKCVKQTYSEIEEDIIEIKKLLESKKMIVVTHYNSTLNGAYIESRNALIHMVVEICKKHGIPVIQPSEVLRDYHQDEMMTSDLGHYTDSGLAAFSDYMNRYLEH
jgi:transcription antitermination factor NusA-like protein